MVLKHFDIFGAINTYKLGRSEKFKTSCGGCCSVIYFVICLMLAAGLCLTLILRVADESPVLSVVNS